MEKLADDLLLAESLWNYEFSMYTCTSHLVSSWEVRRTKTKILGTKKSERWNAKLKITSAHCNLHYVRISCWEFGWKSLPIFQNITSSKVKQNGVISRSLPKNEDLGFHPNFLSTLILCYSMRNSICRAQNCIAIQVLKFYICLQT